MSIPNPAEIHKARADERADGGDMAAAKAEYEKALAINPAYFQAHANLANILLQEYEIDAAIWHFQQAVKLRPDIAELHDSLGRAFASKGISLARAAFREALRLKPDLATAHYNLAGWLVREEQFEEACGHYRRALALAPGLLAAALGLAGVLIDLGRLSEAASLIEDLARSPDAIPPGKTERLRARLAAAEGRHAEALVMWQELVTSGSMKERRFALKALAETYEALGRHAEAFGAISEANALDPGVFEREAVRSRVDRLISLYSLSSMGDYPKASHSLPQPVFIFGMPRSGKSLTGRLMATHHHVFMLDEQYAVAHLPLPDRVGGEALTHEEKEAALGTEDLNRLAADFVDIAEEYMGDVGRSFKGGIRHLVSTPPDNSWRLPFIHRLFPKAALIHVRRHPLDLCLACYCKEFAGEEHAYANHLGDLGFFHRQHHRLVAHWRDVLNIPMLEISYEELVADPLATRARIFDYVGVNGDDADTHPAVDSTLFHTARVGYWQHYKQQLQPLIEALGGAGAGADDAPAVRSITGKGQRQ